MISSCMSFIKKSIAGACIDTWLMQNTYIFNCQTVRTTGLWLSLACQLFKVFFPTVHYPWKTKLSVSQWISKHVLGNCRLYFTHGSKFSMSKSPEVLHSGGIADEVIITYSTTQEWTKTSILHEPNSYKKKKRYISFS